MRYESGVMLLLALVAVLVATFLYLRTRRRQESERNIFMIDATREPPE